MWCTMILSQYVFVHHVTGRHPGEAERQRIVQHYAVTRTADGGWPMHPDGDAHIFTTTLAYVALRMLGVPPDDELTRRSREWLRTQAGGVLGIPTWGKFWLALIDLYDRAGLETFPPELFLVPRWVPGHPDRWYCHTRYIYLAMSYLSARHFTADLGPLRDALRRELYERPYESIDFAAHRRVSPSRLAPHFPAAVRRRALSYGFERILAELRATRYQALSPVNGLLSCLAVYATDPAHVELAPALAGVGAWRWSDETRGVRYAGARSHVWDTAFAARAVLDGFRCGAWSDALTLRRAHAFLLQSQLQEELPDPSSSDRDRIRGGWCFSDGAHRWPVSDCTAEALTAILEIEASGLVAETDRLSAQRVRAALDFLLARQNADGGFSTYEAARSGTWLERWNPAEMFRDCMTERSYVECTASAIEALATVARTYPRLAEPEALARAVAFLRRAQRSDGTFAAAWGVNLTYSTFHVAKALHAAGISRSDPTLQRMVKWLHARQRADGGWGEHFSGCLEGTYVEHPRSQPVMTSWALLALADLDPTSAALAAGVSWLHSAQQADGSWADDAVNGVFFGTAMLGYSLYVSYFPAWALARCASLR